MREGNRVAVDAVLFDVDGTLVDSRDALVQTYAYAVREVWGDRGEDLWQSIDVDYILQLSAAEIFLLLSDGQVGRAARLSDAFHRRYAQIVPEIAWFDGTFDVLRTLRERGVALGIVTTKARERLDLHLASAGVADLFGATISGDEAPRTKPDPAPVRAVLERLGVSARAALLVGDGANDVLAARRAGARSVGVAYGFNPADCRSARPDYWITAISELLLLVPDARR